MKPLIPILIVATTSLAVASVQFAQQASTQRKRADAEVLLRQKQEVRVAELERHQAQLERELATEREQDTAATAPAPVATAPRMAAAGIAGERPPGFVGPPGTPPPPGVFEVRGGRGPFESQAGRNFMRTRMKSQVRRLYGDAGKELGLSAEKSNQLLDLLADQQSRGFGMRPDRLPDGQNFQQYMQEQQKKNAQEITTLIGADKADEWAAYQKTLPQRAQVGAISEQLDQAGVPMSESQRTEMLAAVTEETQRLPPRPTFSQGIPPEEMMTQMNQWQSEYDKAVLDRARQVLNTEQYTAYKEFQDWQTEMRTNLPRGPNGAPGGVVMRSFSAGSGNAVAVGGPVVNFQMAVPAQPIPAEAPVRK
jgi:hypothetical protein